MYQSTLLSRCSEQNKNNRNVVKELPAKMDRVFEQVQYLICCSVDHVSNYYWLCCLPLSHPWAQEEKTKNKFDSIYVEIFPFSSFLLYKLLVVTRTTLKGISLLFILLHPVLMLNNCTRQIFINVISFIVRRNACKKSGNFHVDLQKDLSFIQTCRTQFAVWQASSTQPHICTL